MEGKELKLIIDDRGIKQSWIAGKLHVSTALVSQWIAGTKPISDTHKVELRALLLTSKK